MGQQQLLLLVLATVIVGLATVAGIQAFDENQQQATQDALLQKSLTVATDIKAAASKPAQLGGPSKFDKTGLLEAAGIETEEVGDNSDVVPAPGAGGGAYCDITEASGSGASDLDATIECNSAGDNITVTTDISGGEVQDPSVSTSFGS